MPGKLLDWKLDFRNEQLNQQYENEYTALVSRQAKYALIILIAFGVVLPICSRLFSGTSLTIEIFCAMWGISIWCTLWLPVFFLLKQWKYAGFLVGFIFGSIVLMITIVNIFVPANYLANPQSFHISAFLMIVPLILRPRMKQFILVSIACVLLQFIITVADDEYPLHMRFGYATPNVINLILASYCGYFFEKRWKMDFIRRLINDSQSSKLKWAVSRDSSLLRNIFPKNISDELENQMAVNSKTKSEKKDSKDAKQRPSIKSMKPVVKSITNLVKGRPRRTTSSNSLLGTTPSPDSSPAPAGRVALGARKGSSQNLRGVIKPKQRYESDLAGRVKQLSINVPDMHTLDELFSNTPEVQSTNNSTALNSYVLPPVITAPCTTPHAVPVDFDLPNSLVREGSSLSLRTQPELVNVLNIQQGDGTQIALSHAYPNCAVIFADLVGFTSMSSKISPEQLCTLLNDLFSGFDDAVAFYRLEKIRTVGDAYLCVANMSIPIDNPEEVAVCTALRMINVVRRMKGNLRLRVGIASGPLLAGVTGIMKWNYDIFGEAFVQAINMETLASPNFVAVTKSVYLACKSHPRLFFQTSRAEDGTEYYLLLTSTSLEEIFPRASQTSQQNISDSWKNDTLIDLPQVGNIQDELLKISLAKILGAEEEEEITAQDFQLGAANKLGYSREDVEVEETKLRKFRSVFFTTGTFEHDFQHETITQVHQYTTILSIFFGVMCFLYVLLDIAITPSGNPDAVAASVKIVFCVTALLLFAYAVFARYCDYYRFAGFASFVVITCFSLCFTIVAYISPIQHHYVWCFFAFFYSANYIRTPITLLMLSQIILIASNSVIIFVRAKFPLRSRYVMLECAFFLLCFVAQIALHRSARRNFLMQKKIRFDMFQQQLLQYRTKLLLQNILPAEVIPKLLDTNSTSGIVDSFEQATMMFVNFTNLVELTEGLDAENKFQVYNDLFTLFDEATMAHGMEKIKTINTVYMVACGLPKKIPNHADIAVKLAIEYYRIAAKYTHDSISKKFTVRIGIASGPVVAGIIGKTKYSYDCWSDTTNTASRMESNGWNSYLQATPETFNLLSNKNYFQKRENIDIKGKGVMNTHVLHLAKFVK